MKVRRLSQKDEKKLTKLRTSAYNTSRWFKIKNVAILAWSKDDQSSLVLGLEDNGELIASCCYHKVFEKNLMEKMLCIELDVNINFPSLKIAKAAVSLEKRGHGLTNVLHYFVYKAMLDERADIHSLVSVINEGVGRTILKKEIGFEFTKAKATDANDEDFDDFTPLVLTVLKKEKFARGLSVSEKYSNYPIESFEVEEGLVEELIQYMKIPSAELLPAQ
jgi:hypothetical protein